MKIKKGREFCLLRTGQLNIPAYKKPLKCAGSTFRRLF